MNKPNLLFLAFIAILMCFVGCDKEPEDLEFDIPTLSLMSPDSSAVLSETQPTFSWSGDGQQHFDFYFGTSEDALYKQAAGLTSSTYTIDDMVLKADSTAYYWKVIAVSEDGFRESEVRRFFVY